MLTRAVVVALVVAVLWAPAMPAAALDARFQSVPGRELSAFAENVVHRLVIGKDRAVVSATTIADQTVPAGTVSIEQSGVPSINPSFALVPLAIRVDGKVVRTVYAGYRITTYVDTAVAARDLPRGTVLAQEDVVTGKVAASGHPAVLPAALIGRTVHVAMSKGAVVYPEATGVNEIVKAGQPAVLVVRDGPVSLTADVVARTSGGLGEQVAVYNADTRRSLTGIVTGPGRVELTLTGGAAQ